MDSTPSFRGPESPFGPNKTGRDDREVMMAEREEERDKKKSCLARRHVSDTLSVSCARRLNAVGRVEAGGHVIYGEARHWSSTGAPIKLAFG